MPARLFRGRNRNVDVLWPFVTATTRVRAWRARHAVKLRRRWQCADQRSCARTLADANADPDTDTDTDTHSDTDLELRYG